MALPVFDLERHTTQTSKSEESEREQEARGAAENHSSGNQAVDWVTAVAATRLGDNFSLFGGTNCIRIGVSLSLSLAVAAPAGTDTCSFVRACKDDDGDDDEESGSSIYSGLPESRLGFEGAEWSGKKCSKIKKFFIPVAVVLENGTETGTGRAELQLARRGNEDGR